MATNHFCKGRCVRWKIVPTVALNAVLQLLQRCLHSLGTVDVRHELQ
jgi:hypothetical protein